MTLIDISYFIGERNIPNATVSGSAVGEQLTLFINKYEEELLTKVLGYSLYKSFKTGIEAGTPDTKWIALRDGKEYAYHGKTVKWKGLRITSPVKQSLIADYVYYWFMYNNATQTAAMGEVKTAAENAASVSPGLKMEIAWNEMSKRIDELVCYLDTSIEDYPEWKDQDKHCVLSEFRPINTFNI